MQPLETAIMALGRGVETVPEGHPVQRLVSRSLEDHFGGTYVQTGDQQASGVQVCTFAYPLIYNLGLDLTYVVLV